MSSLSRFAYHQSAPARAASDVDRRVAPLVGYEHGLPRPRASQREATLVADPDRLVEAVGAGRQIHHVLLLCAGDRLLDRRLCIGRPGLVCAVGRLGNVDQVRAVGGNAAGNAHGDARRPVRLPVGRNDLAGGQSAGPLHRGVILLRGSQVGLGLAGPARGSQGGQQKKGCARAAEEGVKEPRHGRDLAMGPVVLSGRTRNQESDANVPRKSYECQRTLVLQQRFHGNRPDCLASHVFHTE